MYYTYILRLSDGQFYVGSTKDLKQRISEHNRGGVKATKNRRPLKLIYYSAFNQSQRATAFEKYLKSSSGKAFRNKRLI